MVVNGEKLLKMVIFQNLSKNGETLKNVGENIKKCFAVIFFYTLDIKNIIFNPKFYQHFLPSLVITNGAINANIHFVCFLRWHCFPWNLWQRLRLAFRACRRYNFCPLNLRQRLAFRGRTC